MFKPLACEGQFSSSTRRWCWRSRLLRERVCASDDHPRLMMPISRSPLSCPKCLEIACSKRSAKARRALCGPEAKSDGMPRLQNYAILNAKPKKRNNLATLMLCHTLSITSCTDEQSAAFRFAYGTPFAMSMPRSRAHGVQKTKCKSKV